MRSSCWQAATRLLPLRQMMLLPGDSGNLMGLMPSYLGGIQSVGVKVIAAFPTNQGTEYDTHQGVVILFDTEYGLLRAIVDGTAVTAIRTAAVSGVATRLLARPDAGDLAIIGAGTQARTHLEAMLAVRPIRRVRVFSLPLAGAHAFAERETRRHGIAVEVMDSARAAVEGADLICTVTSAREPVVLGEWLAPGAHINAVGAFTPTTRELDTDAVAKSRLYVDRRQSTLNEAGEFIIAKAEGAIGDDHIVAELGELLLGKAPGRGLSRRRSPCSSRSASPSKTWPPRITSGARPKRPARGRGWRSVGGITGVCEGSYSESANDRMTQDERRRTDHYAIRTTQYAPRTAEGNTHDTTRRLRSYLPNAPRHAAAHRVCGAGAGDRVGGGVGKRPAHRAADRREAGAAAGRD